MTSTIGSFSLTGSPSFTNHLTTSPSWTPSPMSGSLNSRAISVAKTEGDLTLCPVGGAAECEPFYGRQPIYVRGGVGRGGVAQTGGRDLCSALRAGSVPVLLLLSVRGTDLASSAWNHDIGCARRPGRVRHLPDRDRRVLREPRVLGAWGTDGRERLDAKRAAVRRDRHRPWDQRRGVVADAGMGLGPRAPRVPHHARLPWIQHISRFEVGRGRHAGGPVHPRNRRGGLRVPAERRAGVPPTAADVSRLPRRVRVRRP